MEKTQKTDKNHKNGEQAEDLQVMPAGACGLVDTILHAMVAQEVQDEDYTVISEICGTVIGKARTGDISACRLLFDRISGSPVSFVVPMGKEEEVPIEIGIS